jgi:uncharacterized protein (TIGR00369 family)
MKPVSVNDPRNVFAKVPFTALLGVQREFTENGRARLVLEPRPELGNVIGAIHGGAVFTLLDVAMASAAVSRIGFTHTAVTLHCDASFIEPGRGRLVADGEVLQQGDGVAFCRATVTDDRGRLVANALGSFRYLPLPNPPGDAP